ncbi:IPT/TIG domain-containing protein [Patescibacteria group bacterium]|nr:IPT/TIG domain-containing protein [Patescibacteria group bacterium]MDE1946654.1 peptidoglycan-binding protein [Patescibacteria group bacterium]MDE2010607.1 peptidoglycan-binding protein [Patescibacteria group bacterium]MDE2232946.1 peptidoglycan-binding protein [Patescibacteria group bacterium]
MAKRARFNILIIIAACVVFTGTTYASGIFARNLSIGMSGADVEKLQQLLNSDPTTAVSSYGPGSAGAETDYFGAKTAAAVAKFQEKYARDILTPARLSYGTGYVGPLTRAKLETVAAKLFQPTVSTASSGPAVPEATAYAEAQDVSTLQKSLARGVIPQWAAFAALHADDLLIFGLSNDKVKPGDILVVSGFGLDPDTTIHFGNKVSTSVSTSSGNELIVKIPSIPYGVYDVWVSNTRGTTLGKTPFKITIGAVTDNRPMIFSVSPTHATRDDEVTVTAKGLDASGNNIYSSLGIIKSISSSDGKTIRFKVTDLPNAYGFFNSPSLNKFTVTFGIRTGDGLSVNYGYFIISK